MSKRETYVPGPAARAEVHKEGERWTLILVRELRHPPAMVWEALTDPTQLSAWAPFDADRNLAAPDGPNAWGFAVATGMPWGISYYSWRRLQAAPARAA